MDEFLEWLNEEIESMRPYSIFDEPGKDYSEAIRIRQVYLNLKDDTIEQLAAIKTLEQEPCPDAISRQAVIDAMYALCNTDETLKENPWRDNPHIDAITDAIEDLPPVHSQPKTGHWIFDEILDKHYYCSECKSMGVDYWDFCPYCGARMIEPQETETWNGIHAQITAPKGTFERIFNDADDENDI